MPRSVLRWAFATAAFAALHAEAGDPQIYEPNADPGVGFNLISWWNAGGSGANVWRNAVRDVHGAGFTEVSISPVRFINQSSGSIASSSSQGPELSHIAAGIAEAKSLGMRVTVNPFVEMQGFAFWRGQYNPTPGSSQWSNYWDDYEDYLVDVAQVAQANGADAMNVGTELKAIARNSGNNAKWASVIGAVDAAFTGELGYAANWDNYNHSNVTAAIWDNPAIDYVGIDSYFRNTTTNAESDGSGSDPNETFIGQVEQGWNDRLDQHILPFADGLRGGAGLPVVLTEVGYLPYNRTTVNPQNESGAIDSDEQLMAFKGLNRALDGRQEQLPAIHIWQWGMPGSNGSKWNFNVGGSVDQPNNSAAAQWLSSFVSSPALAGDFNQDGVIDAADYTVWRDNLGGEYDATDYATWAQHYGDSLTPASSAAVPESGSALLVVIGAFWTLLRGVR
ncbi:hypothetical protein MalM25_17960 [Planctomycetes bacterium MalM25]|nr:hypothetical protein MalM25_17960 [Planctomycetes bacterium MalM25]